MSDWEGELCGLWPTEFSARHADLVAHALAIYVGSDGDFIESFAGSSFYSIGRLSGDGICAGTLPAPGATPEELLAHAEWVVNQKGQATNIWLLLPYDIDTVRFVWRFGCSCVSHHSLMVRRGLLTVPVPSLETRVVADSITAHDFRSVHRARYINADDIDAWLSVFGRDEVLMHPQVRACVAYIDGRPAAVGEGVMEGGEAVVFRVATDPSLARKGAGTAVMRALLRQLGMAGCRRVILHSTRAAHKMYLKLGFQDVGMLQTWRFSVGSSVLHR